MYKQHFDNLNSQVLKAYFLWDIRILYWIYIFHKYIVLFTHVLLSLHLIIFKLTFFFAQDVMKILEPGTRFCIKCNHLTIYTILKSMTKFDNWRLHASSLQQWRLIFFPFPTFLSSQRLEQLDQHLEHWSSNLSISDNKKIFKYYMYYIYYIFNTSLNYFQISLKVYK